MTITLIRRIVLVMKGDLLAKKGVVLKGEGEEKPLDNFTALFSVSINDNINVQLNGIMEATL